MNLKLLSNQQLILLKDAHHLKGLRDDINREFTQRGLTPTELTLIRNFIRENQQPLDNAPTKEIPKWYQTILIIFPLSYYTLMFLHILLGGITEYHSVANRKRFWKLIQLGLYLNILILIVFCLANAYW